MANSELMIINGYLGKYYMLANKNHSDFICKESDHTLSKLKDTLTAGSSR